MAKGARRSRRRFANCLDLFCLVELEYSPRKRGDVGFLHGCRLLEGFPCIRKEFLSLTLAAYMVEVTEVLFPLEVAEERMFRLLTRSLALLDKGTPLGPLRTAFLAGALALAGFGIDMARCTRCGRPYKGEGEALFEVEKGGISCARCGAEAPPSIVLPPEAGRMLRRLQEAESEDLPPLLSLDIPWDRIRAALEAHMDYRVGRRPKSARYLD